MEATQQDFDGIRSALEAGDKAGLELALSQCGALSGKLGQTLLWSSGCVSPSWDARALASLLLQKAPTNQAATLVQDLLTAWVTGELQGEHVATIYGARTNQPLDVGEKFAIVPLTPSELLDDPSVSADWARDHSHDTALTMRVTDRQCRKRVPFVDVETRMLQEMEEALGIVSLVCRCGIFRGVHWSRSENWLWPSASRLVTLGEMPAARHMAPHLITPDEAADCRRLHALLIKLPHKTRNVVAFSLRGYRMAVNRLLLEQVAVPITVAIEGLLVQDSQENLAQNVSMRGAWLLASNASERVEYAALLRMVYRLRSDFVHSGGIKTGWALDAGQELREEVRRVEELYRRMVVKLLEQGIPTSEQWTEIVLGRDLSEVMAPAERDAVARS